MEDGGDSKEVNLWERGFEPHVSHLALWVLFSARAPCPPPPRNSELQRVAVSSLTPRKARVTPVYTPAHLVWNGSNVVINLSTVYFKVADMFSNDRPDIYFLLLICIYLQLI